MLDLQVSIHGEKVILHGLESLAAEMPTAIARGLTKVAAGVHRDAFDWLSGPGRATMRLKRGKTQLRGQTDSQGGRPGSYPVPVMTGNLRRLLDWVKPGSSKSSNGHTFTAGPMEAVIYDSAAYASVIHEGTGSSARHGKRPFLDDALARFNGNGALAATIEAEIQSAVEKNGL